MWQLTFFLVGAFLTAGVLLGCLLIPAFLYILPYQSWLESQKKQYNLPKKLESEEWIENVHFDGAAFPYLKYLWRNCINATKLYRSWITKKPHGITKY